MWPGRAFCTCHIETLAGLSVEIRRSKILISFESRLEEHSVVPIQPSKLIRIYWPSLIKFPIDIYKEECLCPSRCIRTVFKLRSSNFSGRSSQRDRSWRGWQFYGTQGLRNKGFITPKNVNSACIRTVFTSQVGWELPGTGRRGVDKFWGGYPERCPVREGVPGGHTYK